MKPWYKSKTVWFNLVVSILAAAELNLKLMQPYIGVEFFQLISFVLIVGNAALRFISTQPIGRNV